MPQRTTSNSRVTRPRNDSERRTNAATSQTRSSFYSVQIRIVLGGETMTLTICATCCALVPSGSKAQQRHLDYHRTVFEAIGGER